MMGLVLAVLLIVAAALLFGRGKKGGEDVTEAAVAEESTDAFGGDRISQDVFVDYSAIAGAGENAQLNLSGMTRSEAGEALKSKYQWSLKVLNSNPNLDKFEMPNIPETEDTSSETGADAEGTVYEVTVDDPLAAVKIRPTKSEFAVPDAVGGEIDSLLDRIFQDYENGALPVKEESESTAADSSEARTADYTLVLPDFSELAADYASQLATVWEVKPKNGDIVSYDKDNDSFVFGGFEDGYAYDKDRIAQDLAQAMKNDYTASIQAAGAVVEGVSQSVKDQYKTIGSFTTKTTANEVRNKNVRLAAAAVNGTVLRPGEEFSFNGTVGERTEAKGYGPAGAYNNGEVVQEIGGGVCQVSSTLFNAVYRAGLTTTYRRSHTFEPSYVTPGCDATVSWGGPDYKFVNNSSHAIGIRASYYNRECSVSIYGVPVLEDGVTWSMDSQKIKDLPLEEPQIITEGSPSAGSTGSEWEVFKIIRKNGETVERVRDHTALYKGHRPTVLAGGLIDEESAEIIPGASESESSSESGEAAGPGATDEQAGPGGGPAGPGGGTSAAPKTTASDEEALGPGGGTAAQSSHSGEEAPGNVVTAPASGDSSGPMPGDEEDDISDDSAGPGGPGAAQVVVPTSAE